MKTLTGLFITGLHLVIICFLFKVHSAIVKLNSELRLANSICNASFGMRRNVFVSPCWQFPNIDLHEGLREGQNILNCLLFPEN